ncbi:MAG: gluconate 2-dehydrogenase subunit 3 family protein, partial [Kangiellaceae bacterium]
QADGDGEFIKKGIGWLNGLSKQTQGDRFLKLSFQQQEKVLEQISQSSTGENWMSILLYYIMEALLFDPIYGGNPDGIGWKWLQHQPGFPAPDSDTLYRKFL